MAYFIESGQIKLLMLSSEGKECLLAIHSGGGTFGELCLSGLDARLEAATAMKTTTLQQISCAQFFWTAPSNPSSPRRLNCEDLCWH
jgi:CRP-like cAMP-binding protein